MSSVPMTMAGSPGGKYTPGIGPMPNICSHPPSQNIRHGMITNGMITPLESRVDDTLFVVTPGIVFVI
jgi:hypothetical protein